MPIDYSKYPPNWKTEIRPDILERADNCCEGSPKFPNCRVPNYTLHPETGSKVVLTIAHMDHDKKNTDYSNLKALCQRCHLSHDINQHVANRKYGRNHKGEHQLKLDLK